MKNNHPPQNDQATTQRGKTQRTLITCSILLLTTVINASSPTPASLIIDVRIVHSGEQSEQARTHLFDGTGKPVLR